jgi:phage gp36-like protein
MAYVTRNELEAVVPASFLVDALDDDRDGAADDGLLESILEQASTECDALLGGRYRLPFSNPPAAVRAAALCLAAEAVQARRLGGDANNPWTSRAALWRERLEKMGRGEMPLDATLEPLSALPSIEAGRENLFSREAQDGL